MLKDQLCWHLHQQFRLSLIHQMTAFKNLKRGNSVSAGTVMLQLWNEGNTLNNQMYSSYLQHIKDITNVS